MIGIAFDHRLLSPDRLRDAVADVADLMVGLLTHPKGRHSFDILDADDRYSQSIRRTLRHCATALARLDGFLPSADDRFAHRDGLHS